MISQLDCESTDKAATALDCLSLQPPPAAADAEEHMAGFSRNCYLFSKTNKKPNT